MAILSIEIPDGYYCDGCQFLQEGFDSQRDPSCPMCNLHNQRLAYKKPDKDVYKLPMCFEPSIGKSKKDDV